MAVEVANPKTENKEIVEEVKKTTQELAEGLYPDNVEKEDEKSESEDETGNETKEENSEKEGKEDTGEQEETEAREDSKEITLTLSKDSPLDDSAIEGMVEFAKEHKLSQELAQAILERDESVATSRKADHDTLVESWAEELKNDPKLGGENLEKTLIIAKRPLEKFGDGVDQGIDKFLKESGFGNRLDVMQYHYNIGKAMGDDTFIKGETPAPKPKTLAERMYPNDVKDVKKE